jgi:hypothetical protein
MRFKTWLEGIFIVANDSMGDVTVDINGSRYVYHTFDGALARRLYEQGRRRPGKVLNILKQFKFTKIN